MNKKNCNKFSNSFNLKTQTLKNNSIINQNRFGYLKPSGSPHSQIGILILLQSQMCKKYIIQIGQEESYPFDGLKENCGIVIVRKSITFLNPQQENLILNKVQLLLSIASPYYVLITRILERKKKYLIIDYQYVPQNLAKSHRINDPSFLISVKDKLVELCQVLSESCIKAQIKIQDVGVTESGDLKVFIDPSFELVPQIKKPNLKREYQSQLQKMLDPYLNFKISIRAHSQLSDYSARLDRKITEIEDKIHKRKFGKSRDSSKSKQSVQSNESNRNNQKKPNIVLESITCKLSMTSESSAKTSHSFIDPEKGGKNRTHKFSFNDFTTTSYKLNQSTNRDDSLTKRLSTALQKSKQTFKIYQKYFKNYNRH